MAQDYWYLASPYSKHPHGMAMAHIEVCQQAALLIKAGIRVYSPIAHMHPISLFGNIPPGDHAIWLPADKPMMDHAFGLIVLKAEGWQDSVGIAEEIGIFIAAYKPIIYISVGEVPQELLTPPEGE